MIPEVKSIVYASDLQPGSRPAFRMAVRLALANNAKLYFITAIEESSSYATARVGNIPESVVKEVKDDSIERLKEKMASRLEKFIDDEMPEGIEFPQDKPEQHVIEGWQPEEAIIGFADKVGADMIIMGKRRKHGLDRLLVGSIANKVLKHSPIPVCIVPLS